MKGIGKIFVLQMICSYRLCPPTLRANQQIKLKDTKLTYRNALHFYTLTANCVKKKPVAFTVASKAEILSNKFNQGGKWSICKLKTTRLQWKKWMEIFFHVHGSEELSVKMSIVLKSNW